MMNSKHECNGKEMRNRCRPIEKMEIFESKGALKLRCYFIYFYYLVISLCPQGVRVLALVPSMLLSLMLLVLSPALALPPSHHPALGNVHQDVSSETS